MSWSGGETRASSDAKKPVTDRNSAPPPGDFAELVSFFLPPPLYLRYSKIINDISSVPGIALDDALGLFVCQLWTIDRDSIVHAARWFGVPSEDIRRCRDRVLDDWDAWENVWDVDAHVQLIGNRAEGTSSEHECADNFSRLVRQCRYSVWLPAFPNGSAYMAALLARCGTGDHSGVPRHTTALARQIIERLDELRLNALIAKDLRDKLRAFYRQHVPGRTRVNALADEALATLEEALQEGSLADQGLRSRPFLDWVRGRALQMLLARTQRGDGTESPQAILDRLRPHLAEFAKSSALQTVDPADLSSTASDARGRTPVGDRRSRRAVARATRRIERRLFLPAGLKPVFSYADQTLATAARHGRLAAVRFLSRWYTTDGAVSHYLPKQEPRAVMKRGFRAAATLSPYAYFVAINRFRHLLVRENNRVFIQEELWWRLKQDLDRPASDPDVLLRFATSQYDYRRLLTASKTGRLEAIHDPHRRAWMTTREQVEAYRSIDRTRRTP